MFAEKQIWNGFAYSGLSTSFVARGRNPLFLRKTDQLQTWPVTVPVYETCIELADVPPVYALDG